MHEPQHNGEPQAGVERPVLSALCAGPADSVVCGSDDEFEVALTLCMASGKVRLIETHGILFPEWGRA